MTHIQRNLSAHLNGSLAPVNHERVDESLILSAIVCSACIAYSAGPLLNTEFMKSVGAGLGNVLTGIGSLFGGISGMFGGGNSTNTNDAKSLLAKDPEDLTQKEKETLLKAAKDPKFKENLTDNEIKKLDKVAKGTSTDKKEDSDDIDDDDSKRLHELLKKKPEDLSPKEKRELTALNDKYDLSDELSDKELKNLKAAGIKTSKNDDDDDTTPENISDALLALAGRANENEKDPEKKKKNAAMLDILTASAYDEDGNPLPMEERKEKMKGLVGEDSWETFENDLNEMQKGVDADEFKKELEKTSESLTKDDITTLKEESVKRGKAATEKIQKENKEREDIDKELEELNKDPETNKDKIKELQDKKSDLIKNSTLGTASPNTAKTAIDKIKEEPKEEPKKDEKEEPKKDDKEPKEEPKEEPKKDDKEPKEEPKEEPKDKSVDDIKKEYDQKSKDLEKEYQEKIDKETDKTKKDELENEWLKKEKALNAEKHKAMDAIDDNDEHDTEKDETKKGKYKVKKEEITDPETGEKKKVTTYTGPRGGKFYYPDGKPKNSKNKVYVHESTKTGLRKYNKLREYLMEKFNLC